METQTECIEQLFSQIEDKRGIVPKQHHQPLLVLGYDVTKPKHNSKQKARGFLALLLKPPTPILPRTEEEVDK
jgi:hypothetical protein